MKIKSKLTAGALMIFFFITGLAAVSVFYLHRVKASYEKIQLQNAAFFGNYNVLIRSLNELERINNLCLHRPDTCVGLKMERTGNVLHFREAIAGMDTVFTRKVPDQILDSVRHAINEYEKVLTNEKPDFVVVMDKLTEVQRLVLNLYNTSQQMSAVNLSKAESRALTATLIVSVLATLAFLFSLTFAFSFPAYIADPLIEVTDKIQNIAKKKYSERIAYRNRKDEVGELAFAFNTMAARLEEYETSGLNDLMVEKNRIEAIVKNLNEGIILLDRNGIIQVINPVAARIYGVNPADVTGMKLETVAGKSEKLKELIEDIRNRQQLKPVKILFRGEEQFYSKEIFEIHKNGRKSSSEGLIISLKNITEYKKLDLDKTTFIAKVSHELKTPVSSINLSLKLLGDERIGTLSNEQKELVASLKEESGRLSTIIKELLDIAQVETGNIRLNLDTVNPEDILTFAIQMVHRQMEEKKIRLVTSVSEQLPPVKADIEKSVWVLTNLLSNAVRYTEESGEILVALRPVMGEVHFSVKDNGPGINHADQEKIFQPFVQLEPGKKKEGVGLGLAISKEFIHKQGGNLWVESQPGAGARFIFSLLSARE
jgi:two-component system, NtrC family, sensor histidine kinase KinB